MLDTFARSGWVFKRIRSKTKWAVEIAQQKRFGIRSFTPAEIPAPVGNSLKNRVLPERKAAAKAKKLLKETDWKDQLKNCEIRNRNSSAKHPKNSADDLSDRLKRINNSVNKRDTKNSKQRKKKAKRKPLKLSRKEKTLIKKFVVKPCIVCLPRLEDKSKTLGKDITNKITESVGVNKRKSKKPERVVILGDCDKNPIILSDEDSDVEFIDSNVSFEGTQHCPIVLNDENDNETVDSNSDDPNDADVEDDSNDDIDNDVDSFEGNSNVFSDNDDDSPPFSKFQNSPKTYGGIRRNFLIAPPTFQPTKYNIAPSKFRVPKLIRTGSLLV